MEITWARTYHHGPNLKVLEIPVRRRRGERDAPAPCECFEMAPCVFDKRHKILAVLRVTASIIGSGILPVKVNAWRSRMLVLL